MGEAAAEKAAEKKAIADMTLWAAEKAAAKEPQAMKAAAVEAAMEEAERQKTDAEIVGSVGGEASGGGWMIVETHEGFMARE